MSDSSGDELANFDPTTPARPAPVKKPVGRPPRAGSRSVAGPSKPTSTAAMRSTSKRVNGAAKAKESEQIVISSSDNEGGANAGDDDEIVALPPPGKPTAKKVPGRPSDSAGNSKAKSSVVKGKARADPPPPPTKADRIATNAADAMDVDESTENNEELSRKRARSGPVDRSSKVNNGGPSHSTKDQEAVTGENERLSRDNEDLRKEIETLKYERDQYSKQLQESLQVRHTEPEQALQEQIALHESWMKNQQLWHELSQEIKQAAASGKSQIPHFLSRDAADAEKETTEKEVARLKDVIKQKDVQLAVKDKRIADLEKEMTDLRLELTQEIERAKTLAIRPPPSGASRPSAKSGDREDPKNGLVIRLYEDITNLLVMSARVEKSEYFDLDEPMYTCIYTYRDPSSTDGTSLNFYLRELWGRPDGFEGRSLPPPSSKADLIQKCKYIPRDLKNEASDFVQRLEFFKEPFLFSRDQLPVFLQTLTNKMQTAVAGDEDDEEGAEEEESKAVEIEVINID